MNELMEMPKKAESFLNPKELDVWQKAEEKGHLPISPSLSADMFNLFLEGYSCAEIAKRNHPLKE
jgi:hypothetical protein